MIFVHNIFFHIFILFFDGSYALFNTTRSHCYINDTSFQLLTISGTFISDKGVLLFQSNMLELHEQEIPYNSNTFLLNVFVSTTKDMDICPLFLNNYFLLTVLYARLTLVRCSFCLHTRCSGPKRPIT